MDRVAPPEAQTVVAGQTITAAFASEHAARDAVRRLERAGMPPDRIGFVTGNVRQAREPAGSYSPQGALVGAVIGMLLVIAYIVFGGDQVRQSPVGIALGGFAIIGGITFIGWLAGRARVFKRDEAADLENEVARGDVLLTVVCDTAAGADQTRAILERAGASDINIEDTAEAV